MHDAVRLIAMVDQAQMLNMKRLASLVDVDARRRAGQRVEEIVVVEDDFAVDLEDDAARAVRKSCC